MINIYLITYKYNYSVDGSHMGDFLFSCFNGDHTHRSNFKQCWVWVVPLTVIWHHLFLTSDPGPGSIVWENYTDCLVSKVGHPIWSRGCKMPGVTNLTLDLIRGVKVLIWSRKFDPLILTRGQSFDPGLGFYKPRTSLRHILTPWSVVQTRFQSWLFPT